MNFSNKDPTNKFLLLGAVAIIAIVGLVLLFTNQMAGMTQLGIGDPYGITPGIAETTPLPPYDPYGPRPEFPAGPVDTIGTRTPIMIFFKGEYGTIKEMSKCWEDLSFKMPAPQEAFSCYAVPTSGPAYEVTGWFWPTSSAMPKPLYQIGGDVYCYERTPYIRSELFNRFQPVLEKEGWVLGEVNGQQVLICQKGAEFIYPQGLPRW